MEMVRLTLSEILLEFQVPLVIASRSTNRKEIKLMIFAIFRQYLTGGNQTERSMKSILEISMGTQVLI